MDARLTCGPRLTLRNERADEGAVGSRVGRLEAKRGSSENTSSTYARTDTRVPESLQDNLPTDCGERMIQYRYEPSAAPTAAMTKAAEMRLFPGDGVSLLLWRSVG